MINDNKRMILFPSIFLLGLCKNALAFTTTTVPARSRHTQLPTASLVTNGGTKSLSWRNDRLAFIAMEASPSSNEGKRRYIIHSYGVTLSKCLSSILYKSCTYILIQTTHSPSYHIITSHHINSILTILSHLTTFCR